MELVEECDRRLPVEAWLAAGDDRFESVPPSADFRGSMLTMALACASAEELAMEMDGAAAVSSTCFRPFLPGDDELVGDEGLMGSFS